MTALAADYARKYKRQLNLQAYQVAASTRIYKGGLVGVNAAGYLVAYTDVSTISFAGVAAEGADNSAGANGAITCRVARDCLMKFAKSGTITVANLGDLVNGADDNTVQLALATLTIDCTNAQSDIVWTSLLQGSEGEQITVEYVNPGGASASLSVDVQGTGIKINLATGTDSAITSTADLVKAAVAALPAAAALVVGTDAAGNDGSGVVEAKAEAALAIGGPDVGHIAEIDADGSVWVDTRLKAA